MSAEETEQVAQLEKRPTELELVWAKREARREKLAALAKAAALLEPKNERKEEQKSFRSRGQQIRSRSGLCGSKKLREFEVAEALHFMSRVLVELINAYDESFDEEVQKLLNHAARGEQDEAEAMLQGANPDLLVARGTVMDYSQRVFIDITAFQYALWALDWHMWTMILKYLPREAAADQLDELQERGTLHGKHCKLTGFMKAMRHFLDTYGEVIMGESVTRWCQEVGVAQLGLPAHVINEYCHPFRSFALCPNFDSTEKLPRSMNLEEGHWFTAVSNGGTLGVTFGVIRAEYPSARGRDGTGSWGCGGSYDITFEMVELASRDYHAMQKLFTTRQNQLNELDRGLTEYMKTFEANKLKLAAKNLW